jgi:hypothetical protein
LQEEQQKKLPRPETPKREKVVQEVKENPMYKQSPLGSELPFTQIVNKSGLKGAKRNPLSYISKTINDKNLASKLRVINRDSNAKISSDQI